MLTNSGKRDHTKDLFRTTNILPIDKIYDCQVISFMFKFHKGMLPNSFSNMFKYNVNIHDHNTRQSKCLHLPKTKYVLTQKFLSYYGVNLWNKYCVLVNTYCSIHNFKKEIKMLMIDN